MVRQAIFMKTTSSTKQNGKKEKLKNENGKWRNGKLKSKHNIFPMSASSRRCLLIIFQIKGLKCLITVEKDFFTIRYKNNLKRFPKKYGNMFLNNGISWGLAAPRPPRGFPRVLRGFPRVLGHGGNLKNNFWKSDFLMIFRSVSRPHQRVYSCPIRSGIWSPVILEKSRKI